MNFMQVCDLVERLSKEKFFGKLEIKFRNGVPYFCVRQEFLSVTPDGIAAVDPMTQVSPVKQANSNNSYLREEKK